MINTKEYIKFNKVQFSFSNAVEKQKEKSI